MGILGWWRRGRESALQLGERLTTLEVDLVLSDGIEARPAPTYREATRRIAELARQQVPTEGLLHTVAPADGPPPTSPPPATGSDRELAGLLAHLKRAPAPTERFALAADAPAPATGTGLVAALEVLAPAEERAAAGLDPLPVEPVPAVRVATAQKVAATAGRTVVARTTITVTGDVVTEIDQHHLDDLAAYLPVHGLGIEAATASWKNLVDAVVALVGTLGRTRLDR